MTRAHLTDPKDPIRPAWWAAAVVAGLVLWAVIWSIL